MAGSGLDEKLSWRWMFNDEKLNLLSTILGASFESEAFRNLRVFESAGVSWLMSSVAVTA